MILKKILENFFIQLSFSYRRSLLEPVVRGDESSDELLLVRVSLEAGGGGEAGADETADAAGVGFDGADVDPPAGAAEGTYAGNGSLRFSLEFSSLVFPPVRVRSFDACEEELAPIAAAGGIHHGSEKTGRLQPYGSGV